MSVFLYTHAEGIDILKNLRLKVSDATRLNDPFELLPVIDPTELTEQKIAQILKQRRHIDLAYSENGRTNGFTNKKDFKRTYLKNLPALAARKSREAKGNIEYAKQSFAENFAQGFRLLCTSKTERSVLMWAHYADKHQGLVFEIDDTTGPFETIGSAFRLEVEYEQARSPYLIEHKLGNAQNHLLAVARRKAKDWFYEQEVRFVILADFCPGNYLKIPASVLRRVILGIRARPPLKADVRALLDRPDLSHVALERAVPSKTEFAIDFEQLSAVRPTPTPASATSPALGR